MNTSTQPVYALTVFRVLPNTNIFARMLSEECRGVMTHFKKRSYVCQGDSCPSFLHADPSPVWKGYVAAEGYHLARKKWCPIVLEVTEHLELDFRGLYKRGQIWEIFRTLGKKNKAGPMEGKLNLELDPADVPKAFDVLPTLRALYHVSDIALNAVNPMPPRTLVTDSDGDAPLGVESAKPEKVISAEEMEELTRKFNERKKSPVSNGKPH